MDERQQQIQTGAGLTEARLNTEFIDALKKWGPWVVMLVAAVVLGYVGLGRLREARERSRAESFGAFNEAERAGNPVNLIRVAEENAALPGLAAQSRISAADALMLSIARGVMPGVEVPPDGLVHVNDLMNAEQKSTLLEQAKTQYQMALETSDAHPELWVQRLGALMGLAAVAETTGKFDDAKSAYQRAVEVAQKQELAEMAKVIQERLKTLESLPTITLIPSAKVRSRPADPPSFDFTPIIPDSTDALQAVPPVMGGAGQS